MIDSARHWSDLAGEHGGSAAARGGKFANSGEDVTKQAWLRLLRTLAELYGADRAIVKRR